jgi:hypothetical protein
MFGIERIRKCGEPESGVDALVGKTHLLSIMLTESAKCSEMLLADIAQPRRCDFPSRQTHGLEYCDPPITSFC